MRIWSLASLRGLRAQRCHKLWRGLHMQLRSGVAVAVADGGQELQLEIDPTPKTSKTPQEFPQKRKGKKKKKKKQFQIVSCEWGEGTDEEWGWSYFRLHYQGKSFWEADVWTETWNVRGGSPVENVPGEGYCRQRQQPGRGSLADERAQWSRPVQKYSYLMFNWINLLYSRN